MIEKLLNKIGYMKKSEMDRYYSDLAKLWKATNGKTVKINNLEKVVKEQKVKLRSFRATVGHLRREKKKS